MNNQTPNTNISDKAWVRNALKFWSTVKPSKFATPRIIKWNVKVLTEVLETL
jgi:hypothetical protein